MLISKQKLIVTKQVSLYYWKLSCNWTKFINTSFDFQPLQNIRLTSATIPTRSMNPCGPVSVSAGSGSLLFPPTCLCQTGSPLAASALSLLSPSGVRMPSSPLKASGSDHQFLPMCTTVSSSIGSASSFHQIFSGGGVGESSVVSPTSSLPSPCHLQSSFHGSLKRRLSDKGNIPLATGKSD